VDESKSNQVADAMRRINRTWIDGRVDDLAPLVHPDVVMVFPGFGGQVQGRDAFLAGFRDFLQTAKIHEFQDDDLQVNVAGNVGVTGVRFSMIYERAGQRYHSTGRDLWVFENQGGAWIAVWRTMLDMVEEDA
jgi:ketosteroid isomerase-like protein